MTSDDISELERLEREATAGPWCIHPNGTSLWSGANYDSDDREQTHLLNGVRVTEQTVANLWMLCEARNALPELLAMAKRCLELSAYQNEFKCDLESSKRRALAAEAERNRATADLLATRRALKLAQAVVMNLHAQNYGHIGNFGIARAERARKLCAHYAAKFEREAGEVK